MMLTRQQVAEAVRADELQWRAACPLINDMDYLFLAETSLLIGSTCEEKACKRCSRMWLNACPKVRNYPTAN